MQVHQLPQHLPAISGSKPLAKLSQTGLDQLSNNHKPQPAKAAGSASRFAASRTVATLFRNPAKLKSLTILQGGMRYDTIPDAEHT